MNQTVSFPGLGIGEFTINRVAFSVFGHPIYWYGIIIALAFLLGILYIVKRSHIFGLDSDRVMDVVLGAVIGGIIGARFYYVIFSWDQYRDNLADVIKIWEGGIAIYGGVIGGFLVGALMSRIRKVRFIPMADLAVGGLILGQSIGRWGNFINVEAFGSNTGLPWGMASPSIAEYLTRHQAALAAQGVAVDPAMPVHPTFFYESMWCLIGFILIALAAKHRRFDGELTLLYVAWYGAGRAVIEGLRTDSLMWGSVRVSQALAVILVIASIAVWLLVRSKIKQSGDQEYLKLYVNTAEGQAVINGTFYKKPAEEQHPSEVQTPSEAETPSAEQQESVNSSEEKQTTDKAEGEYDQDESKAD